MNTLQENDQLASINNNYSHEIRDIYKKNRDMSMEITLIRNRIKKLKDEEQNYNKKLVTIRESEKKEHKIQEDKMKLQKELALIKKQQMKELKQKKQRIHEQKIKFEKKKKKREEENILAKKTEYKIALNNKYLNKYIKEQMVHQQKNINNFLHEKVRQQYNESMSNKVRSDLIKKNKLKLQYEENISNLKKLEKEIKDERDELSRMEKRYQEHKTNNKNIIYLKYRKINYPKLNTITPMHNNGNISEEMILVNNNSHYDILSSNSAILSKNRKNKKCASSSDISNNTLVDYCDRFCTDNKKNNKENTNRNRAIMTVKIRNKNKSMSSLEVDERYTRSIEKKFNVTRKIAYANRIRNHNKTEIY